MSYRIHTNLHNSSPIFADDGDWSTRIGDRYYAVLLDENGNEVDSEDINIFSDEEATTETKWDEAEERLLARHGLTRSDVITDHPANSH